jgi:hypothetical protein
MVIRARMGGVHDPALPDDSVTVEMWRQDAVVLFDWLQRVDVDQIPTTHRAERQALMDFLSRLEVTIPWPSPDDIDAARASVAQGMD